MKRVVIATYPTQPMNASLFSLPFPSDVIVEAVYVYLPGIRPVSPGPLARTIRISFRKARQWYLNRNVAGWWQLARFGPRLRFYRGIKDLIPRLRANPPDLFVFLAGEIIPPEIYEHIPTVIYHCGPVPRYRGADVGFWQLYNREKTFKGSILYAKDPVDSGPVLLTGEFPVPDGETATGILRRTHELQAELGSRLVHDVLNELGRRPLGEGRPQPLVVDCPVYGKATAADLQRFEELVAARAMEHKK